MSHRKRILFAAVDIGYRIEHYTKFINENLSAQFEAESFSKYVLPSAHYKTKYTYTCPVDKTHPVLLYLYSFCFFVFSLFRYDIFHFISGETLLTRKLRRFEFTVYKLLGKRIIMHFVGADIRSVDYELWKVKNIKSFLNGVDDYPKTFPWQDKLIKDTEKFADYILVSTPDLKEIIPSAEYYPVMLDYEKFQEEAGLPTNKKDSKDEIVILHAPSSIVRINKGTTYIEPVLNKIASMSGYKIKLVLPYKNIQERPTNYPSTRYELFGLLKEADIVIDQMIVGWYGLISVEALAAEKCVICYVGEKLKPYLFKDCPIQIADINTLENVLLDCIEKVAGKKLNLHQQMEWIKKNHTIENNHSALLRAWGIL
jgi:hypothetical protein